MGFLDATGITTLVEKLKDKFALKAEMSNKQDILVSGTNIKTVNGNSLLGSGNVQISLPSMLPSSQIRLTQATHKASDTGYKYRLWLTSADGAMWVPINTSSSTSSSTEKTLNTRPIDPFGPIIYFDNNGTTTSGNDLTVDKVWMKYGSFTIGYSYVISLTQRSPIYLKCTPQANGSAVMNVLTQTLPSSNDGYIYIFLGVATSSTAMELYLEHPVYYHDGTGIRLWTGAATGGGASRLTLYVQRAISGQILYADSACTTTFIEECDGDYREAYNRIKSADIVEIRWIESASAGRDFICSSINYDFADDTVTVYSVMPNGVVYFVV